jgi:hypothetical protein
MTDHLAMALYQAWHDTEWPDGKEFDEVARAARDYIAAEIYRERMAVASDWYSGLKPGDKHLYMLGMEHAAKVVGRKS